MKIGEIIRKESIRPFSSYFSDSTADASFWKFIYYFLK